MLSRLHVHRNKFLAVIALALVMAAGFGVREALSADADLQQYNGSAVWADDLTAASTLLPRDGKRITADSNAVGSAPVNRSLKQLKDYLTAVHEGVFGIGAATRRTVKSLEADGTGGAVSTLLAGAIASNTANDRSLMTPTDVSVFKVSPTGGISLLDKGRLTWTNVADGGGNPLKTAGVANAALPLNQAKVWATINTSTGSIFLTDGFNVSSVAIGPGNKITINFASSFANALYACVAAAAVGVGPTAIVGLIDPADKLTGSVKITYGVNPAVTDFEQTIVCYGRQTT